MLMKKILSIWLLTAIAATAATPIPLAKRWKPADIGGYRINGRSLTPDLLPLGTDLKQCIPVTGSEHKPISLAKLSAPMRATHLLFTHTYQPGQGIEDWRRAAALAHQKCELPPDGPTVFTYEIHYADGVVLDMPVRWFESIGPWYRVQTVAPMLWVDEMRIEEIDPIAREQAVSYVMKWPNPRPEQDIAEIRVHANDDRHIDYGDALIMGVATVNEPSRGKVYYVDPTPVGSDDQPGTFEKPWGTIQHAFDSVKPGDTVFLRGGYYSLHRAAVLEDYGEEEGQWLTISAYPGETPVIDGFGVLFDTRLKPHNPEGKNRPPYEHDTGVIAVRNVSGYLRIQGLHVQNSQRAGISVHGLFKHNARQGSYTNPRFIEVNFNTTYQCNEMGIITHHVDDLKVNGNRICRPHSERMVYLNNGLTPANKTNHGQEGLDLSRNQRFEVAYNEVYGGGKEAIDLISVQDGRVHHNYVHSSLNGIYIDSWSIPIERVEVDHNFIHNAYRGIPCSTEGSNNLLDFRIHHNIIFYCKEGGISIGEATYKAKPATIRGHVVYNNTADLNGYHVDAVTWLGNDYGFGGFTDNRGYRDVTFVNNIGTRHAHWPMATRIWDMEAHNLRAAYNLLWPNEDRVPEHVRKQKAYPEFRLVKGEHTVDKDPMYMDPGRGDYRLRKGSPAIDAGDPDPKYNDPDGSRADIGALPYGAAWMPGFDWCGKVTAYYQGDRVYEPVDIPDNKFTLHRNHLQRPSWFQQGRYGQDFQTLPSGLHSWGGITWNIETDDKPSVLTLRGEPGEVKTESITGIPVLKKADTLAFLQAWHIRPILREIKRKDKDARIEVFHYIVQYADDTETKIPVIWDEHIGNWFGGLDNLPEARLARATPLLGKNGEGKDFMRLYAMEWKNPKPNVEIRSLDMVSSQPFEYGAPAVFAISTGRAYEAE